jgi:hypothetical protein
VSICAGGAFYVGVFRLLLLHVTLGETLHAAVLTSWQVLLAIASVLMAIALLIERAIPARLRPDGHFIEVAELTF